MNKVVLFCKSYDRDMYRARRMAESIMRFNRDNIPLFLSVPQINLQEFKECFGEIPCVFITDEEVLGETCKANGKLPGLFPPHLLQQLVKLEFWRLDLCENYVWIDSDSYFIRDFYEDYFFYEDKFPYIFQREYKVEKELTAMTHIHRKIRRKRVTENVELILRFKNFFGNSGPLLAFAGSMPIIWSVLVLKSFNEDFLKKCGKNIYQILEEYPCETQLYGEYLHSNKVIPVHPRPFMFRSFLYAEDFYASQMQGECEYSIAKDFYGMCMQSNWALVREKKNTRNRIKGHIFDFLRSLKGGS